MKLSNDKCEILALQQELDQISHIKSDLKVEKEKSKTKIVLEEERLTPKKGDSANA